MTAELDRYARLLPKKWVAANQNWQTLLSAVGAEDAELKRQLTNGREQLFISTAVGVYLEALAEALQVYRSAAEWLSDDNFRLVIPVLGARKKQRRSTIYKLAQTVYPTEAVFAVATTPLADTYAVTHGDTFSIWVPEYGTQTRTFCPEDIHTSGAATTEELIAFFSRFSGITAEVTTDLDGEAQRISLCTTAPGPSARIEILSSSTAVGVGKLEFPVDQILTLTNSEHRFSVWEVSPGLVTIELPRTSGFFVNLSRSSLFCISEGAAAAEDYASFWGVGSGVSGFTLNGASSAIAGSSGISAGSQLKYLEVEDATEFSTSGGFLTINFELTGEEVGVPFLGVANPHTLRMDPTHTFIADHAVGATVSEVAQTSGAIPMVGDEIAAGFINKLSLGFTTMQNWIRGLIAEGFVVTFDSFEPEYTYLISNPILEEDLQ